MSFAQSIRENTFGLRLGEIFPALEGLSPADLLPRPRLNLSLRHTVGLGDPLTDGEVPAAERLDDGLPQSLEACIQRYGLTHFKIKVTDEAGQTIEKMTALARIIRANCRTFAFTLDGNECFQQIEAFRDFWGELRGDPTVGPFLREGLLAVEQPLHRDVALNEETKRVMLEWTDRPAIIIDESGGDLESLPRALECGYAGTSHKNCKGVIPGVANACLLEHLRRKNPRSTYVLTCEDLMNVGPVALLQDLAVAATLGIQHLERNGHHYVKGLSAFPDALQRNMLRQHGDLYHRVETSGESFASLRIENGEIDVGSVVGAPFGYNIDIDVNDFDTLEAIERAMSPD